MLPNVRNETSGMAVNLSDPPRMPTLYGYRIYCKIRVLAVQRDGDHHTTSSDSVRYTERYSKKASDYPRRIRFIVND